MGDVMSRHYTMLMLYSGYMVKGLNYIEIMYAERLIKPIDLLNIWVVMMACKSPLMIYKYIFYF